MNDRCEHCGQTLQGDILHNGPLKIDASRREVFVGGDYVDLTKREFDLLLFFMRNKGKILTFKYIMENVWGRGYLDQLNYIRVFLVEIRKKLAQYPSLADLILAKRSIGYEMVDLDLSVRRAA